MLNRKTTRKLTEKNSKYRKNLHLIKSKFHKIFKGKNLEHAKKINPDYILICSEHLTLQASYRDRKF